MGTIQLVRIKGGRALDPALISMESCMVGTSRGGMLLGIVVREILAQCYPTQLALLSKESSLALLLGGIVFGEVVREILAQRYPTQNDNDIESYYYLGIMWPRTKLIIKHVLYAS
jgi:hypothetical protein